jgi:hypothetical protein
MEAFSKTLTINIELTTKIGEKFLNVRTKFGNDFPNFSFLYQLGVMTISEMRRTIIIASVSFVIVS